MRNNLVMHFCCSECGGVLNMRLKSEESAESSRRPCLDAEPKIPSGAFCVGVDPVQIEPCGQCREDHLGPAIKLIQALEEVKASLGKSRKS